MGPDSQADLAGEGRATACVAELGHLVKKRGRPHVRVVDETGGQVWEETLQRAQPGPPAYTRLPLVLQMVLDCPPVSSDVAADRCVRPPLFLSALISTSSPCVIVTFGLLPALKA